MSTYITTIKFDGNKGGELQSEGKSRLGVCPPPEFGGDAGVWTPEELLSGAVGSCLMMTALFFIKKQKLQLSSFEVEATASMQKGSAGFEFTNVAVIFKAAAGSEADQLAFERIAHQAESYCPVSGALKCPVELSVDCSVA